MKKLAKMMFFVCALSMLLSLVGCSAMDLSSGMMDGGYGGYAPISPGGDKGSMESPEYGGDDVFDEAPGGDDAGAEGGESDSGEEVKPDEIYLPSGMITAGAWVDNDNYQMWLDLFAQGEQENGKFYEYTSSSNSLGFNSQNRVKVTVKNGENAVAGATVIASDSQGNSLFSAVSDAQGNAYLFVDELEGTVTVTSGEGSASAVFSKDERELSVELSQSAGKINVIEIMLVVDVTGSMGDEINFLKAEISDVISKIAENNSNAAIKLAMLFYRDKNDAVPFRYFDFTNVNEKSGMDQQQASLNTQIAEGGGDYPEAVDEALEMAVNQKWSTGATTKIIFHVLDAPLHSGSKYESNFVNAVKNAAEKGIRICPILCSGADGLTEYSMREAAIYTGGTFVFVTDDSGIGGSHHDPNLPNVTVELLNSLMVRLVNGYHTGNFEPPVYWKDDPNLATK